MRAALPLLALVACGPGGSTDAPPDDTALGPVVEVIATPTGRTNADGLFTVEVDVDPQTTAFLVTGVSDAWLSVEQVRAPSGRVVLDWQDWWDGADALTEAFDPFYRDVVLNWPIRDVDGPLRPGRYEVDLATTDDGGSYLPRTPVQATVQRKRDPDLTRGTVDVTLAFTADLPDEGAVAEAVDAALDQWRAIWDVHGLAIEVTRRATTLAPQVPEPEDDPEVEALSAQGTDTDVLVILGQVIANDPTTLGIAGGIPGSPLASGRSATVVSWLLHAGGDGTMSPDEAAVLGETMAHEVGHYLGLFHPVEDGFFDWDALDDTDRCTDGFACETSLGANNMFPYPICDDRSCIAQTELSAQQAAVLHRYTATR